MHHLPDLIADLGLILATAGITTLVFKKIKQPIVLGYILAGLLVGPHFSMLPTVVDEKSISTWSEIGVIFLLFSLGLEFSFKKLVKVGGSASITAIVEVVFMLLIGYIAGVAMGWSTMDSIFLGGILSVSSTTIIIRAFEELGVKTQKFAGLVFGVLVVEDLVAILLMVLLSTVAVSQNFAGAELGMELLKLCFFLILWFLGGIFLIPTFLKRTRKLMNDETMLVVSLALCLLMVLLATNAGFSAALGAFIMGSLLAETTQAERIEHLTKSVKDLFAAIFFVSVGMLIDPQVLLDYAVPVIVVTLATIVGKLFSTALGALISGQSLKVSVQAGMSLAQIGEFSFIIATLGLSLKVTSEFLYPIAVAASAVTTFTTPYMIRLSVPFYNLLERTLPARWIRALDRYSTDTHQLKTHRSDWKVLLRSYITSLVINSVVLVAIIFLSARVLYPLISENLLAGRQGTIVTIVLTLIIMAPFLWALAIRRIQKKAYAHLWLNKRLSRGPLMALEFFRIGLAMLFVGFLLWQFFYTWVTVVVALVLTAGMLIIFSRRLQVFYDRIEGRFLSNLNEREAQQAKRAEIVPWDAHLADFDVPAECSIVGRTLSELAFREQYGVNIALIERGNLTIPTPGKDERLYPGDKIAVIGTDEELASIRELFEAPVSTTDEEEMQKSDLALQAVTISEGSPLLAKSIRHSGIRENAKALVVGIERAGQRILNPDSSTVFEDGDIVWIVGNGKRIGSLFEQEVE